MKELGDKVSSEDKDKVEGSIKKLREAIEKENFEEMKNLNKSLQDELMEIGKKVYSANENPAQQTTNTQKKDDNDSVIDADFSETK